ncbi:hypothetical protein CYMTET_26366 [Cymbomonas tetramitiformis]|uniref:Uncharacterized protein n=1 Tax=Cymbomonas tetramitiformis TaxID=36881 RepID=A0AAE0FRV3_9CHLO|nr:hypothetical protein CYMTET_26366 [Cymbomonas tetramitiformis]
MDEAKKLLDESEELGKQPGRGVPALTKAESAIETLAKLEITAPAEGETPSDEAKMMALANCCAGDCKLTLGRPKEAEPFYSKAKSMDPGLLRATAGFAGVRGALGGLAEAKAILDPISNPAPGAPQLAVGDSIAIGRAYVLAGDEVEGEKMLKSAWARGGDPYELAVAQVNKYIKLRTDEKVGPAVDGYNVAVDSLKNAARLNRKDCRPKYKLGLLCEEMYHHQLLYGGIKKAEDDAVSGEATDVANQMNAAFKTWSATAMEDEIAAIAQQQGCWGTPTIEEILSALLGYHRECVEKGRQEEADTIMILYQFKSRQLLSKGGKAGKDYKLDKNLQAAMKEYEETTQNVQVPEVMVHMARIKKLAGFPDKGLDIAKKALALDPEHAVTKMYVALLSEPLDLESSNPCPKSLYDAAAAVEECLDIAVAQGPAVKMCLGEELCHVLNPDMAAAAVAVARGHNAAKDFAKAEAMAKKLMALLPEAMKGIHWASVLQVELAQLVGYTREVLLTAMVERKAGEEAVPLYEDLYKEVAEAAASGRSLPALDRLVQACRLGLLIRPMSSEYRVRLADAIWNRVDKDLSYEKKDKKDAKKALLTEVDQLLRASFELEGKPMYEPQAAPAPPTPVATPRVEEPAPAEAPKPATPAAAPKAPAASKPGTPAAAGRGAAARPGVRGAAAKPAPAAAKPAAKPAAGRGAPAGRAGAAGRGAAAAKPGAPAKPGAKPGAKPAAGAAATKPAEAAKKEPAKAAEPAKPEPPPPPPNNPKSVKARVDLSRVLREVGMSEGLSDEARGECVKCYQEASGRCGPFAASLPRVDDVARPIASLPEVYDVCDHVASCPVDDVARPPASLLPQWTF